MLLAALFSLFLTSAPASAQSMALEPQNRIHAGLSLVDGPSPLGLTAGMDSRLTRVLALDIGAFVSPVPIASDYESPYADPTAVQARHVRHGVYATPGFRIPHPQPKRWAWEFFVRAGGGVIWTANVAPDAPLDADTEFGIRPDPAGLIGGDALIRFGRLGVRASGKVWMFEVLQTSPSRSFFAARPQWGLEALVQW